MTATPSILDTIGRCARCWDDRMGQLPDFVVVPRSEAAALRLELRDALGCEPPSVHDMVKDAAAGSLVVGGLMRVYFGSEWACGMDLPPAVLEAVEEARAASEEPPHAGLILPPSIQ